MPQIVYHIHTMTSEVGWVMALVVGSEAGSVTAYIVETLIVLVAVIALAAVMLWGARRLGFAHVQGPCQLVGRLPLDPRRCIYLVRVRDEVLVLGVSEAGITKLSQYRYDRDAETEAISSQLSFAETLARLRGQRSTKPNNMTTTTPASTALPTSEPEITAPKITIPATIHSGPKPDFTHITLPQPHSEA